jgi:hypothetical protein
MFCLQRLDFRREPLDGQVLHSKGVVLRGSERRSLGENGIFGAEFLLVQESGDQLEEWCQ